MIKLVVKDKKLSHDKLVSLILEDTEKRLNQLIEERSQQYHKARNELLHLEDGNNHD